jgi:hypothetical protein
MSKIEIQRMTWRTFKKWESEVFNIPCNMVILMLVPKRKFKAFRVPATLSWTLALTRNLKVKKNKRRLSQRKRDKVPTSHLPIVFKVEEKVDIKSYEGEINIVKLNQWLQLLEFYFSVLN